MSDYGKAIHVEIESNPIRLDKKTELSTNRIILGYLKMVYRMDADMTMTIYVRKNEDMNYEAIDPITISKDHKRLSLKLPIDIGAIIDFYVKFTGEFKRDCTITVCKILLKPKPAGKFS